MSFAARAAVPVSTSAWSTGFVTSDSSFLHSSPSWQRAWGPFKPDHDGYTRRSGS